MTSDFSHLNQCSSVPPIAVHHLIRSYWRAPARLIEVQRGPTSVIAGAGCCTSLLYRASVFQENVRVHASPLQFT